MKQLDIMAQTFLFLLIVILLIPYGFFSIAIGQIFIGVWQMGSSIISVAAGTPHKTLRRIHLVVATAYLTLLATKTIDNDVAVFFAPWALAIFYYIITWKWFLMNEKKGKFLGNISF